LTSDRLALEKLHKSYTVIGGLNACLLGEYSPGPGATNFIPDVSRLEVPMRKLGLNSWLNIAGE